MRLNFDIPVPGAARRESVIVNVRKMREMWG